MNTLAQALSFSDLNGSNRIMNSRIEALVQAAVRAAQQGHWREAEQLWTQVRHFQPNHPQALHSLGMHALRSGRLNEALDLIRKAHLAAPAEPMILVSLAGVCRERGDSAGEVQAIELALAAEPYCWPALLAKARVFERTGSVRAAAAVYRNVLKIAPPEPQWPVALRESLQQARACVERDKREMSDFLASRLGSRFDQLNHKHVARWREAAAIVCGESRPYPSVPNKLLVPRLPALPFFERDLFPWVGGLEARTPEITEEMCAVHAGQPEAFRPYVAYERGTPVNQWQELNHSARWSSFFLWQNGSPVLANINQCPQTAAALAEVEMADIGGLCPNAMFSALAPRTSIPPHHGETNARLVVHLPLVVPENCMYRVGYERRRWNVGEALIFDDSIEHEARNDSDELRVVLIFDVWNPLLSASEREVVRELSAAQLEFESNG